MKMNLPGTTGERALNLPEPGTRQIRYSWSWRTGTLHRTTRYADEDGRGTGCSNDVMFCLWGWIKKAPKPAKLKDVISAQLKDVN